MDVLAEKEGKVYGAITIHGPGDFESPFPKSLFACLIWDHAGHLGPEERSKVANTLIEAGCRYAVCGGANCEAWHDAVDTEDIKKHVAASDAVREEELVMTTWHDHESADDVAYFFVENTDFGNHDFNRYLVLHIGTSDVTDVLHAAVRKYARNEKTA